MPIVEIARATNRYTNTDPETYRYLTMGLPKGGRPGPNVECGSGTKRLFPGELERSATNVRAVDLDVVFQPIVDLTVGSLFAVEALCRCKWSEFKNPAVPPTRASSAWTVHVKPKGGSQLAMASGSRNARQTFSGLAVKTRCSRTVLGMTLSFPLGRV